MAAQLTEDAEGELESRLDDIVVTQYNESSKMALVHDKESGLYLHPAFIGETRHIMKSLEWWHEHKSPIRMSYDRLVTGDAENKDEVSYFVFREGKCQEHLSIGRSWLEEGEQIEVDYWATRAAYNHTMQHVIFHLMFDTSLRTRRGIC